MDALSPLTMFICDVACHITMYDLSRFFVMSQSSHCNTPWYDAVCMEVGTGAHLSHRDMDDVAGFDVAVHIVGLM